MAMLKIITRIARKCPRCDRRQQPREWSKKFVQQGRSLFDARSVLSVREHDKMATYLRVAASAKAGNAAGGFFQHSLNGDSIRPTMR